MFKKMYVHAKTFIFVFFLLGLALQADATEMGIPVQLRLRKPDLSYPTETLAVVTLRILSNTGCVLRQEEFINQDVTEGSLTLSLGTGTLVSPDPGLSLNAVYNNTVAKTNLTCINASNTVLAVGQTYTPVATDGRILRLTTTVSGENLIVDFNMKSAPYAIQAEAVGGKSGVDILVRNTGTQLNQTNLENLLLDNTRLTNLLNIATAGQALTSVSATNAVNAVNANTAVDFSGSLSGDVTGTQSGTVVSKLRGVNLSATVPTLGQVLTYDGSQYVPATPGAAAVLSVNGKTGAVVLTSADIPGLVTSATAILGDVTGNISATVVSSVGGKSAATIATAVNDVSSATSLATANTLVKRDGSGNVFANTVSALNTSVQNVNIYEGTNTNYVRLKAPNSFSNYILTLPVDDGSNGQMLTTDGSGNLSWTAGSGVTSAAIISALGFTPADNAQVTLKSNNLSDLSSSATARTNLGLGGAAVLNVGTSAGSVAAGDDPRIVNALSSSANFSGDISGTVSNATVTKVQGVGVSFTAVANNHLLQYNGTNFVNRAVPTCSAGEYLTFNGTAWSCATDVGSAGVIASLNVTAPISSTGGANPTLSMAQASGSTNGYLVSADWTTFNNKMAATSAAVISALGYTPASSTALGSYALKSNNLSDLASSATARTNLGLGGAAVLNVGTSAGTVAAGDDARITGALSQTSFNAYVASANCTAGQSMYWNSVSSTFLCQVINVSGDISGTVSNATVAKIQGTGVSITALASNHLLQYNGTNYVNRAIPTCSAGEYLTFNGTAWSCVVDVGSAGVIASLNVTAPISSTGGANPTLSMAQATGSTNGYLASSDWTTFNNKMAATSAAVISALGYTPASSTALGSYVLKSNNLSDLSSSATARTNLGLGGAAVLNVGTTASTVAAGDDSRIVNALSTSTNFSGDISGVYNSIVLANSGVIAGTYATVSVDAKGRVTSGNALTSANVTTALGFTPISNSLQSAKFYVGNGSNVASAVTMSGDATLANTGALTLKNTGTAGTYGAADKALTVTTDAQGRVTAVSENSISIVSSQVTNFATTVLGTVLTGFSTATATAVTAADTVLAAIGKIQGQLNTILNPATTMVSASGNITTTSATDVTMTGVTITPPAGTYQVYFATSVTSSSNGAVISMELYGGGVAVANSQTQTTPRVAAGVNNASLTLNQTVIGEVTVNGSQAIDIRWSTSGGTATSVGTRMMVIHRVR